VPLSSRRESWFRRRKRYVGITVRSLAEVRNEKDEKGMQLKIQREARVKRPHERLGVRLRQEKDMRAEKKKEKYARARRVLYAKHFGQSGYAPPIDRKG